jgi:hypothetical protein
MTAFKLRVAGFSLFAAAFFIPAVGNVQFWSGPNSAPGWECAYFATFEAVAVPISAFDRHSDTRISNWLLSLSAWVVPLVLIYLYSLKSIAPRIVRRVVAGAILIGVTTSWLFFYCQFNLPSEQHAVPLLGH